MSEAHASVSGTLHVGEASAAVRDLQYRVQGSMIGYYVAFAAAMVGCALGGYFLVSWAWPGEEWGVLLGVIVGVVAFRLFWRRLLVRRFRDRLTARGVAMELPLSVEIGPEALVNEVGGVKRIVQWPAVTELFHSHGYWIFICQGDPIFVPDRLFASTKEQRACVAAALSHMSESAKARSGDAVAFAAGTS
jgi:MFS family permease